MKKIFRFFFVMIFSLLCCSCQKKDDSLILLKGDLSLTSTQQLSSIELKNKIINQEDFVLIVTLSTCATCEKFKQEILNPYIEQTHAIIYSIDLIHLNQDDEYENKPYCQKAPQIFIYQNGKMVNTLKYEYGKAEYEDVEAFKTYMKKYVKEPKLLAISEELLDNKINNQESFILYIGWNKCGDCSLLENRILNDYLKNSNIDCQIYYLESDLYRSLLPKEKPQYSDTFTPDEQAKYEEDLKNYNNWVAFSTKYHFNFYRNGKVPTLQYYNQGITSKENMVVYHNDVLKDGVVIESYFDELINTIMSEESLLAYHDQKVYDFLNQYFK